MMKQIVPITFLIFISYLSELKAQTEEIFDQYQQILPRGRIAAIFEPAYITADSADINAESWVLGIEISGKARAYSLNLLNHHEVVNDVIDTIHFAVVW